ncbi:MAG: ATP-binding protein [bacterium]|nr:ATP-binding protein [bacterium]
MSIDQNPSSNTETTTAQKYPLGSRYYIISPSEWGQQACDHLLHGMMSWEGHVTLVIPRRDEDKFRTFKPAIKAWSDFDSVEDACKKLNGLGRPIDYMFDDRLDSIHARMIQNKTEGYRVIVYITSTAEYHFDHTKAFCDYADRVLVEKPCTPFFHQLADFEEYVGKHGRENKIRSAEHYLFRPGVTAALRDDDHYNLRSFLTAKRGQKLEYTFCFAEAVGHDDPNMRLSAYNDGSILDIAVIHGLGPVARILLPALGLDKDFDLAEHLTWTHVTPYKATDSSKKHQTVATLAETAVELRGRLTGKLEDGSTLDVDITLRSAKGCEQYQRYFEFRTASADPENDPDNTDYFGVSLGSSGYSVKYREAEGDRTYHRDHEGGKASDEDKRGRSGASNAQAAMLTALSRDEWDDDNDAKGRFIPIKQTCQILRLGFHAQSFASCAAHNPYVWGYKFKFKDWSDTQEAGDWDGAAGDDDGDITRVIDDHVTYADYETSIRASDEDVFDLISKVFRFEEESPLYRFFTCIGEEGVGHGDVSVAIREFYQSYAEQRDAAANSKAQRMPTPLSVDDFLYISIARDEQWVRDTPKSDIGYQFTLDDVVRKIAGFFKEAPQAGRDAAGALTERFGKITDWRGKGFDAPRLIVINRVDRLSDKSWQALVFLLDALPIFTRVILLSNRGDRKAGFIYQTKRAVKGCNEFYRSMRTSRGGGRRETDIGSGVKRSLSKAIGDIVDPADLPNLMPNTSWYAHAHNVSIVGQLAGRKSKIASLVQLLAGDNITLHRQLNSYILYVAAPMAVHCNSEYLVEDYLKALAVPQSLTPNPTAMMNRISRFVLADMDQKHFTSIRSLAVLDSLDAELIEKRFPDLYAAIKEDQPVKALFDIRGGDDIQRMYSWCRRAALKVSNRELRALRDERHRRLMLLHTVREIPFRRNEFSGEIQRYRSRYLALLFGSGVRNLPLSWNLFGESAYRVIQSLAFEGSESIAMATACIDNLTRNSGDSVDLDIQVWARFEATAGMWLFEGVDAVAAQEQVGLRRLEAAFKMAMVPRRYADNYHQEDHIFKPLRSAGVRYLMALLSRASLRERMLEVRGHWKDEYPEADTVASVLNVELEELRRDGNGPSTDKSYDCARILRALSLYRFLRYDMPIQPGKTPADLSEEAAAMYVKAVRNCHAIRSYYEAAILTPEDGDGTKSKVRLVKCAEDLYLSMQSNRETISEYHRVYIDLLSRFLQGDLVDHHADLKRRFYQTGQRRFANILKRVVVGLKKRAMSTTRSSKG